MIDLSALGSLQLLTQTGIEPQQASSEPGAKPSKAGDSQSFMWLYFEALFPKPKPEVIEDPLAKGQKLENSDGNEVKPESEAVAANSETSAVNEASPDQASGKQVGNQNQNEAETPSGLEANVIAWLQAAGYPLPQSEASPGKAEGQSEQASQQTINMSANQSTALPQALLQANAQTQPGVSPNQTGAQPGAGQSTEEAEMESLMMSEALNEDKTDQQWSRSKLNRSDTTELATAMPKSASELIDMITASSESKSMLKAMNPAVMTPSDAAASPTTPSANNPIKTLDIPVNISKFDWGDHFNQQIVWLGQQQIKTALIQIHPQELGPLQISLKMDKDNAQLHVISHSPEVKNLLEQTMPRLRDLMAEQGVQLTETNIESQARQFDQSRQSYVPSPTATLEQPEEGRGVTSQVTPLKGRGETGLVDYFA